ncbi:MAG: HEPN domain-containing protein [Deltaproteobacteria bacterium]|nr:HEPN domain-containing protein [Deltaproteobacteria bacterium]
MDEGVRKQASEWFQRGEREIETADLLYDEEGYTDAIAYHIQQAIEKYLQGYLVLREQKPPRIHDLDTLLNLVAVLEPDLYPPYIDLCEKATRYYIEDRYPPGPPVEYDRSAIKEDLVLARELIRALRKKASLCLSC